MPFVSDFLIIHIALIEFLLQKGWVSVHPCLSQAIQGLYCWHMVQLMPCNSVACVMKPKLAYPETTVLQTFCDTILLMEELLHEVECMKPCRYWDNLLFNWCRILSINSTISSSNLGWQMHSYQVTSHFVLLFGLSSSFFEVGYLPI